MAEGVSGIGGGTQYVAIQLCGTTFAGDTVKSLEDWNCGAVLFLYPYMAIVVTTMNTKIDLLKTSSLIQI